MNIDVIKVGSLETNCYLVYYDTKCLIIDPGADENAIISRIKEKELDPIAILITHNHIDHTKCARSIANMYGINIYNYNSLFEGLNTIGDFEFDIIYTPGHEEQSLCIYFKDYKVMFDGDFIFKGDIGRTDLATSNYEDMLKSIEKIKQYPDDITLYPGHGEMTTLGYEKKNNKYLQ